MKKLLLIASFCAFVCFLAFGDTEEQEVDYLLFSPNSSDTFEDERQSMIHLNNVAKYLMDRDLISGQIQVYGYAADVANDIDPIDLSIARAVFVISELEKRGLSKDMFAEPKGFGSVNLWGTGEDDRSLNRRVRIVLDGNILIPAAVETVEEVIIASAYEDEEEAEEVIEESLEESIENEKPNREFSWHLLLPLLLAVLAAVLFWLFKSRKKPTKRIIEKTPAPAPVPVVVSEIVVYLEDEIRYHAYMLFLQRKGRNGDMDGDWYQSVAETGSRYKSDGYQVYIADGYWWARKSSVQTML